MRLTGAERHARLLNHVWPVPEPKNPAHCADEAECLSTKLTTLLKDGFNGDARISFNHY